MRKLLPILLALIGLGAGVGGGLALRSPPGEVVLNPCGEDPAHPVAAAPAPAAPGEAGAGTHDYVKLNNQFVVPVVEAARVRALVILSISLEVPVGGSEQVFAREPKLRDGFLQVLFDHANAGGFDGAFTNANNMTILRRALLESARKTMGDSVTDVLIADIARQDN